LKININNDPMLVTVEDHIVYMTSISNKIELHISSETLKEVETVSSTHCCVSWYDDNLILRNIENKVVKIPYTGTVAFQTLDECILGKQDRGIKVIFLDMDGVMNIMGDAYRSTDYINLGTQAVEPHLMRRLEYLIEEVEKDGVPVKIVISSSWSEYNVLLTMNRLRFKYMNAFIGRTKRDVKWRGNQIQAWLDETDKNVVKYVVLEDEPCDVCGEKCAIIPKEYVVPVNMDTGLSDKNVEVAINKLKVYRLTSPVGEYSIVKQVIDNVVTQYD